MEWPRGGEGSAAAALRAPLPARVRERPSVVPLWLGAQLGMSKGLSQDGSFFMGFPHSSGLLLEGPSWLPLHTQHSNGDS